MRSNARNSAKHDVLIALFCSDYLSFFSYHPVLRIRVLANLSFPDLCSTSVDTCELNNDNSFSLVEVPPHSSELRDVSASVSHDAGCQAKPDVADVAVECCITKGIIQLRAANEALERKLKLVTKQKQELSKENKRLKTKTHQRKLVGEALREIYSPAQVRRIMKSRIKFVRNYSKQDITTALVLKTISNEAYKFLRSQKFMALPSRTTLSKWLQDFRCAPGIQHDSLRGVMEKLQRAESPHEKLVTVSFDEMELKQKYEYHTTTKKIYGPSNKLQAVLIRGITHNWKQLVYFNVDTPMKRPLFGSILRQVEEESGAEICAVTFDLGNKSFVSEFGLTEETHWINLPGGRKIFAIPDACHMLKLARNHILDEGLLLPPDHEVVLSRRDFLDLIEKNLESREDLQMTFKLTMLHVTCKSSERQHVYLAAQLLSHTVAKALEYLFGKEKQGRAVQTINDWFDVMNSRQITSANKLNSAFGIHFEEQLHALTAMENLVTAGPAVGKSRQPWEKGVVMGIRSVKELYQDLKNRYDLSFIMTSRLNQVFLE